MSPPSEPAGDLTLSKPPVDIAAVDSAAPIFGIALGIVVMIVLALNAIAY